MNLFNNNLGNFPKTMEILVDALQKDLARVKLGIQSWILDGIIQGVILKILSNLEYW